jgi:ABC-2 type transport system ATP-binding protein
MALLEAFGLTKIFRHQWTMRSIPVLTDVSLSLREGEVLGLIGPNGAGKTTTIKMLLALLRPTRGYVEFDGMPISRPAARRQIGFLPEQPYFYDYLSVEETLHFYGQLCGLSRTDRNQRVSELIERLQLDQYRRRSMRQLSKGNLQRVGVAQAIVHRPRLAILDEPMSGLDPNGRKEMRDLIAGLRSEGTTVIFSSHILPDAEALCDRVAVITAGRLREVIELAPGGLHQGPFVLRVSSLPPTTLVALDDLALEPRSPGGECWVFRMANREAVQRALALVSAAGGFVESLVAEQPSLEERFLSHVRGETRAS